jgi:hypothetical protein
MGDDNVIAFPGVDLDEVDAVMDEGNGLHVFEKSETMEEVLAMAVANTIRNIMASIHGLPPKTRLTTLAYCMGAEGEHQIHHGEMTMEEFTEFLDDVSTEAEMFRDARERKRPRG